MVKTIAVFIASLFITIFASAAFAQSPSYSPSTNSGASSTTNTMTTTPSSSVTRTQQGVGGSGASNLPNQAPSTGLGGLSK